MPRSAPVLLARERIRRVLERWFLSEPLLFILWQDHQLRSGAVHTIQVGAGVITYNPEFIDSLSSTELEAVMRCEAVRILLKHPYTRCQHPPSIAWQASNITLREHLGILPLPLPTAAEIFGHHCYDRQFLEFYHQHLLERAATTSTAVPRTHAGIRQNGDDPATTPAHSAHLNNDAGTPIKASNAQVADVDADATPSDNRLIAAPSLQAYVFSSRVGAENAQPWANHELHKERIDRHIEDAERQRRWGSLPGHLREQILANRKPRLDYRSVLRLFHQTVLAQKRRLSRMKYNRRYGFLYMGSRYDFTTRLLVAVDVSGSMSKAEIGLGFSLVNRFFYYGIEQIDVIAFDAQIQGALATLKRARREVTITGRGGTNFDAVIAYIDQHPHYDGVIIITDGDAPRPRRPRQRRIPLLWVFIDESSYLRNCQNVRPLGHAVFIRPSAV